MNFLITKILQGIMWVGITIIRGFLVWIDICDAVLTTFTVWLLMQVFYDWNGWWALALGLTVSLILYIIFKHRIGFWVVSTLYSALWGYVSVSLTKFFFVKDMSDIWFWAWTVGIAALAFRQHDVTRYRKEILAELAAEDAAKAGH